MKWENDYINVYGWRLGEIISTLDDYGKDGWEPWYYDQIGGIIYLKKTIAEEAE